MTDSEVIEVLEKEESYMLSHGGDRQAKALRIAIDKVKQEPCEDAVSRKAVHDMLENLPVTVENKWFNWLQKACIRLAELPTVTPQQPRVHAKILIKPNPRDEYSTYHHCSNCDEVLPIYYDKLNYCPNCGAYVRKVEK